MKRKGHCRLERRFRYYCNDEFNQLNYFFRLLERDRATAIEYSRDGAMDAVLKIRSLMNTNLLCLQTSVKQYMGKKIQDTFIRIKYQHCAAKRLSL